MSVTHQELQAALLLSIDARLKTANAPKELEMTAKHKASLQLAAMINKHLMR
jgi:predicted component of type VI protein secretion system